MRNHSLLLIALFILFTPMLGAQTNIDIRRKDFKKADEGFKEAWKHVEKGDGFYSGKGIFYKNALEEYLLAIKYNDSNPQLNYKAGVSALLSDKKELAADLLIKAWNAKNDITDDILLLTGRALQYSGSYNEAIEKLTGYVNSPVKKNDDNKARAGKYIAECTSALSLTKDTLNAVIENLGPNINSPADDYSEVISSDGKTIYFASRRETKKSSDAYYDSKFDENIFVSHNVDNSWEPSVSAGKNLTTKYCEAPLGISNSNDSLYIYEGYENLGDIKVSVSKEGKWSLPRLLPFKVNSSGRETSFTISPSGDEIWYVTDNGKNNLGGKDLYYIKKTAGGKWSKEVNAGPAINTVYDEESVRFSTKGDTLYFSSKGHNTIGGFDIFYSVKSSTGAWGEAKNFGYPVNTPWDEIFFYPSPFNGKRFWFVSNRSGGLGFTDIYSGALLIVPEDTVITEPFVPVFTDSVKQVGQVAIDSAGVSVLQDVPLATASVATISVEETNAAVNAASVPAAVPAVVVAAPAVIAATDVKDIVFENIYFDSGKSTLSESAKAVLAHNLDLIRKNPGIRLEIAGHNDKTKDESFNFKISGERAQVVKDYFVQNGADGKLIEATAYGSLKPAADNKTEDGRAKNRRVEIIITEF
jgi:outer membrane protein OmpA-like peptidoglycan-associated protein